MIFSPSLLGRTLSGYFIPVEEHMFLVEFYYIPYF